MAEPALDVMASWLQDRYTEAEQRATGAPCELNCGEWPFFVEIDSESDLRAAEAFRDGNSPAIVLADLASKRALLADLMVEPHDSYCGSTCTSAHVCDRSCTCDRDARVLRRLRILASPFTGRDDMPAELRES